MTKRKYPRAGPPPCLPGEQFRSHPQFSNYMVSSLGRIWTKNYGGRIMRPRTYDKAQGRTQVDFCRNGLKFHQTVHRAVALTFHGWPPPGCEVSHLNGDARDNRAVNLAWETPKENQARRKEHGTYLYGESATVVVLNYKQVTEIRRLYGPRRYSTVRLGREFGVNAKTIWNVIAGRTWRQGPSASNVAPAAD